MGTSRDFEKTHPDMDLRKLNNLIRILRDMRDWDPEGKEAGFTSKERGALEISILTASGEFELTGVTVEEDKIVLCAHPDSGTMCFTMDSLLSIIEDVEEPERRTVKLDAPTTNPDGGDPWNIWGWYDEDMRLEAKEDPDVWMHFAISEPALKLN